MFKVILISADPTVSTMTMDWNIIGESQSNCSSTNLNACTDINIFFNKYEYINLYSYMYVLTACHFVAIY